MKAFLVEGSEARAEKVSLPARKLTKAQPLVDDFKVNKKNPHTVYDLIIHTKNRK